MKTIKSNFEIKFIVVLIIVLVGLFSFLTKSQASNLPKQKTTDTLKYDLKTLSERYGKRIATKILQGIVDYGYSKTMVLHAKGKPYLIEEPLGPMLDYEIFYYKDVIVFIEYGVVVRIKDIGPPSSNPEEETTIN